MNILELLKEASANAPKVEFGIIKASKDKKYLLADDDTVFSTTNINKSVAEGLIEVTEDTIKLIKGRSFANQDGITFFTNKEQSTPAF
jgi:hypothetical protein